MRERKRQDRAPRSQCARRFLRVRQHSLAKLSALAFITLILLPFTAPFPTYQLDPGHGSPYDALPKEFKNKLDSDDGLILPSDCRLSLPALSEVSTRSFVHANQIVDYPLQHTVLRL